MISTEQLRAALLQGLTKPGPQRRDSETILAQGGEVVTLLDMPATAEARGEASIILQAIHTGGRVGDPALGETIFNGQRVNSQDHVGLLHTGHEQGGSYHVWWSCNDGRLRLHGRTPRGTSPTLNQYAWAAVALVECAPINTKES